MVCGEFLPGSIPDSKNMSVDGLIFKLPLGVNMCVNVVPEGLASQSGCICLILRVDSRSTAVLTAQRKSDGEHGGKEGLSHLCIK